MRINNLNAIRIYSAVAGILLTVGLFVIMMLCYGKNPFLTLEAIFYGAFGTAFGLKETLTRATPLLLCGLAAAIPIRAGIFNIGAEGQLYFAAIMATAVVIKMLWLPHSLVIPVMIVVSLLAGAIWALFTAVFRTYFKVNEILVGLMLNFIAILLMEYLVYGAWRDPSALGWPYSVAFPEWAILPKFSGSNIHLGLLFGICFSVLMYFVLRLTKWGFTIRVIEANLATARYIGINTNRYVLILMMLGGALAGLAGLGEVSVVQGRLRSSLSPGYGYTGFLIAWLAGNHVLWIIPICILVGGLYAGADAVQLTAGLPSAMTDVFMGLVFIGFMVSLYLRDKQSNAERR